MSGNAARPRLAVVCTHPIQYYAPWFKHLAEAGKVELRVFYLFQPPPAGIDDPFFGRTISWDVPLLDGYDHEFVPNVSARPGVGRFWGFRNPELRARVLSFKPGAVLLVGYNFWSLLRFILTWPTRRAPLIFRGDSHRLVASSSVSAWLKQSLIAMLFRRFAAFLFVGEANRRYFALHGVRPAQLFHAPHAIDNDRFRESASKGNDDAVAWRRSLGIRDGDLLVLFAGKLEQKKRPTDLLHAFVELAPADASLLFVGDGPLADSLRAAASGHERVFFAPFQNQSMMPLVYAASDLLVLPSYGPFETWGLAVNESMAVGKPVIVSSHVGCAEDLVIEDRTGLVFKAGDVEALRGALAIALQDRARLARWGHAAQEHIAGYSYAAAAQGLMSAMTHMATN